MKHVHELKTHPAEFQAVWFGQKSFEIRRCDDRTFEVGDSLHLKEWNPETEQYTGRWTSKQVVYLVKGPAWGLPAELCVMGIK